MNLRAPRFDGLRHVAGNHVDHLFTTGRAGVRAEVLDRGRALRPSARRRYPRVMRAALLVLLTSLLLAACGGDDDSGSASTDGCASDAVVVKMANIKFDPETASANVGDTVCWENDDTVDHNAVANSGADFKSPLFGKGKTFSTKLDTRRHGQVRVHRAPGHDRRDRRQGLGGRRPPYSSAEPEAAEEQERLLADGAVLRQHAERGRGAVEVVERADAQEPIVLELGVDDRVHAR